MAGGVIVAVDERLDPRVARSRRAVLDAVIDELGDVGYGAMTVESVARRAGVGKATVYRHWDGKLDLVESALDLLREDVMVATEGSPRERIAGTIRGLADYLGNSRLSECLPALVSAAQHDDAVREFHHRFSAGRRRVLIELVEEAQRAGEVRADTDPRLLAEALVGPIFYRRLMTPEPFPSDRVDELIETLLPPP